MLHHPSNYVFYKNKNLTDISGNNKTKTIYNASEIVAVVPTMTSNTAPSGTASASTVYNDLTMYAPCNAFNKTNTGDGDCWVSKTTGYPQWIMYTYPAGIIAKVTKYAITNRNCPTSIESAKSWQLQGSNDGENWDVLHIVENDVNNNQSARREYDVTSPDYYNSYRLYITDGYASAYVIIANLDLYASDFANEEDIFICNGYNTYATTFVMPQLSRFTMSAFLNICVSGKTQGIFTNHKAGAIWPSYHFVITTSGYVDFTININNTAESRYICTAATPLVIGEWAFVTIRYDGSTLKIYLNGTEDKSIAASGTPYNNTQTCVMGVDSVSGGTAFNWLSGAIKNFSIFNKALPETDIRRLMLNLHPISI